MLVLIPTETAWVSDGVSRVLGGVERVVIERVASRLVIEHGDLGSHAAFVDCPEQETRVTVIRRPAEAEVDLWSALRPGAAGTLRIRTAANASDAEASRVFVSCVVKASRMEASGEGGRAGGVAQRVEFLGVSAEGIDDPVSVVEGG